MEVASQPFMAAHQDMDTMEIDIDMDVDVDVDVDVYEATVAQEPELEVRAVSPRAHLEPPDHHLGRRRARISGRYWHTTSDPRDLQRRPLARAPAGEGVHQRA